MQLTFLCSEIKKKNLSSGDLELHNTLLLIIVTLLGSKTPKGYFYKRKKCNSIAVGFNLIFQFYFFFCKTGITLVAKLVFRSNDAKKKKNLYILQCIHLVPVANILPLLWPYQYSTASFRFSYMELA